MFSWKDWKELRICHKLKNEIHIKVSLTALAWTSAWGLLNMPDRAHTSILKRHANYMSLHVNETCLHSKKINFFFSYTKNSNQTNHASNEHSIWRPVDGNKMTSMGKLPLF